MSGRRTVTAVTGPQQAVLDYISWFTGAKGYPPTKRTLRVVAQEGPR